MRGYDVGRFHGEREVTVRELLWLAIPLLATLVAIAWNSWRTRTKGPDEARDSVEAYERFRAALTAVPQQPDGSADGAAGTRGAAPRRGRRSRVAPSRRDAA